MKDKRILIAEDEHSLAKAMPSKLEHMGYEIVHAASGHQVMQALLENTFDLILLDIVLPEMNGFELLESFKKQGIKTPVFVVSSLGQPEDAKKAKELGAEEFFDKSKSPLANIVEAVERRLK